MKAYHSKATTDQKHAELKRKKKRKISNITWFLNIDIQGDATVLHCFRAKIPWKSVELLLPFITWKTPEEWPGDMLITSVP